MKLFFVILLLVGVSVFSQNNEKKNEKKIRRNEIKINPALIETGFIDISYERILNKKHSVGVNIPVFYPSPFFGVANGGFMLQGYYKYFFSKEKFATGFFIKLSAGIAYFKNDYFDYKDFMFGAPVGYKWNIKRFSLELHADLMGIAYHQFNLYNSFKLFVPSYDVVAINLGFRF